MSELDISALFFSIWLSTTNTHVYKFPLYGFLGFKMPRPSIWRNVNYSHFNGWQATSTIQIRKSSTKFSVISTFNNAAFHRRLTAGLSIFMHW